MPILKRTDSKDQDFVSLVKALDSELAVRDGDEHAFYDQFNKIDALQFALVIYLKKKPVGCGAIKAFDDSSMEIKRMYVLPEHRKKGYAQIILAGLEAWAMELGKNRCVLETGKKQPEAMQLYLRQGYKIISNYGQYQGIDNSVCFAKVFKKD